MSRFSNTEVMRSPKSEATQRTTNRAGGEAYRQSDKLAFVSLLLTSKLKDKFYETANEQITRLIQLADKVSPQFAAKASVYARDKFGMRSTSHLIAAVVAGSVKGESWVKDYLYAVVVRPDDVLEIMGAYKALLKKPLTNSMRKGLGKALTKFDEYQIAKYRRETAAFSLVDAVNLLHPPHTEALGKLIRGALKAPETWETKLTGAGQIATTEEERDDLKASAWKSLILEGKIGYMALVKNLRNILEAKLEEEVIKKACSLLEDPNRICKSRIFPYRFTTALEQLEATGGLSGTQEVLVSLSRAVDISCQNVPKFAGRTLVVLDVSASMNGEPSKIGSLFAAVMIKANSADLILFAEGAAYRTVNPSDSTITIARSIGFSGGGTNFSSVFHTASRAYDRIVILSDMQGWMVQSGYGYHSDPKPAFLQYKRRTGANPRIFSFDLQGYGDLQFPEANVFCLAGFSNETLPLMEKLDKDPTALISEVEQVSFYGEG